MFKILSLLFHSIIINYLILSYQFYIIKSFEYVDWTPLTPTLPRGSNSMAVAYDNTKNTIWLLGGDIGNVPSNNYKQLISFKNNIFIDHGSTNLSGDGIYGLSQYYTQMNHQLYMINIAGNGFNTFNIQTQSIQYNSLSTQIPHNVGSYGCLTSINDNEYQFLIVVGGQYISQIQILNITSNKWIANITQMQKPRASLACIVYQDNLYAIGGKENINSALNSIEILNVSELQSVQIQNTSFINNSLPTTLSDHRAIVYNNDIIIIGGLISNGVYNDKIIAIDAITNRITYTTVSFKGSFMSPIIQYPFIYVFGGQNWNLPQQNMDTAQYHTLPTATPTQSPITASPTNNPSVQPTLSPSQSTATPTNTPTQSPTKRPTLGEKYIYVRKTGCDVGICSSWNTKYENDVCINKISFLSQDEKNKCCVNSRRRRRNLLSISPTIDPTLEPTFVPTGNPTVEPTIQSTISPTIITNAPTETPTYNNVLCDDNYRNGYKYCYNISINPFNVPHVATISIQNADNDVDTYFDINITSNNYDCIEPSIS
eukprot:111753_1